MFDSMHNDIAAMLTNLREQRERMAEAAKEMRAVTASATTKDRMIKATVDSRGRLTELAFSGNRWRDLAPKEFAAKVVDVITRAQDKSMKAVTGLAAGVAPEGIDIAQILENGPDLSDMLADITNPKGGDHD